MTVSDDAAFIYNLWGFGNIEEMELLQEAGFHPLEIFRGATVPAPRASSSPRASPSSTASSVPGCSPTWWSSTRIRSHNLKVLYGTGAERLNDQTGKVERVGGVKYTIKDGIVYDAKELLADVARMVETAKMGKATDSAGR